LPAKKPLGAQFLLHETLGCPIANLHSARSDLWEPQFVLRPTQLHKKHYFVKSTSNDLTADGITTFGACHKNNNATWVEKPNHQNCITCHKIQRTLKIRETERSEVMIFSPQ
jgi:hypothetical protein